MSAVALPLVGREAEVSVLERTLEAVDAGRCRALGLVGEAGIGKSRLLAELAGRARERGWLVLAGRAGELERDLTFALLLDALEAGVSGDGERALMGLERGQLSELAAVLPAVGPLADVKPAALSGERHRGGARGAGAAGAAGGRTARGAAAR